MAQQQLSFLIPAYNCEDVIDQAIESALAQTCDLDTEIVIVDDASTDATAEHARAWVERYPGRVHVGSHERNRGGAAARNTAASLASGELLYVLDSDNVLSDGCVASQVELMRTTGLDAISVGQLYYFEGSVTDVTDGWVQRHTDGRSTLRHMFESIKVPPSHGNYLFTRRLWAAVGGYPEDAAAMDTWAFGLRHLARGFEIGVDTRSHYFHRLNRPSRESYWSREQSRGTNDVNAIRALLKDVEYLPPDLRELALALAPNDRFFALVSAGAFMSDRSHFRDVHRLERIEHSTLTAWRGLLSLAGRLRTLTRGRRPDASVRLAD